MKPNETSLPEVTENEKAAVALAAQAFEDLCRERHTLGQAEYGEYTFLTNDTLRMAVEEVADLRNYATMTGIKILLLGAALQDSGASLSEPFKGTKEGWGQ